MANHFGGVDWSAGINFTMPAYAQKFLQLISDVYASFIYGGYYATATSASRAPATGSQSFTIVSDRVMIGPGMFVICASATNPRTNYLAGVVTASSTSGITVNGLVAVGTTPDTNWNICVIGMVSLSAPGTTQQGQTGQTTALATLQALNIDTPSICGEPIYDDFGGALIAKGDGINFALGDWGVYQQNGGVLRANAATLYSGDLAKYNLDPTKTPSTLTDWASHPGVLALEVASTFDSIKLSYGRTGPVAAYGITNTSSMVQDVHLQIPTAFTNTDYATFFAAITDDPGGSYIVPENFSTTILGIVIGRAVGYDPMRVFVVESTSGSPTYTDTGITLNAAQWYTIRLTRTGWLILASDNKMGTFAVVGSGTFTAHSLTAGIYPQMSLRKMAGSSKRSVLVDYYAFKPGATTR